VTFNASKPNIARVYDFILGGKDNFAADREVAAKLLQAYPLVALMARENRMFLVRAVGYAARQGITQYIDVGAGLPTAPNTHEVAQAEDASARVVYVDNDPMVLSHAQSLLAKHDGVAAVAGDLRDPDTILASPELTALIDLARPVCVLLASVLHFVDEPTARHVSGAFARRMAPGSYLVVSVGVGSAEFQAELGPLYTAGNAYSHSPEQVAGFFAGLELIPPGLVDAVGWQSEWEPPPRSQREGFMLAGMARK
jgi:O-methyltransferase involved in polyketide biosynthesis